MQLMRNSLKQLFPKVKDAHAGLLMQRGLMQWEEGDKAVKAGLIRTISQVTPNNLYLLAFERWLNKTYEEGNPSFTTLAASVEGRLYTGLPLGGTLETGASIHHTYGMPMLPGSSVKGAVRSYTEHLFAELDVNGDLQFIKSDNINKLLIQEDKQKVIDILFGKDSDEIDDADAGYLIWHDAWWIPKTDDKGNMLSGDMYKPFINEVVTVHHQAYYSGEANEALDMENPIPNQQLAIQGSFYFAIEGDKQWADLAKALLQKMLENVGIGSKTSSGYGYFKCDDELANAIGRRYAMGIPVNDSDDPSAAIRQVIKYRDEDQLIEDLSKGKTNFFKELGLDKDNIEDIKLVVQIVMEEHAEIVNSWSNAQKKSNMDKAFKFLHKDHSA